MRMKRYSPEFKELVVRKMMPPENVLIMRFSEESGVSYVTLAKWRTKCGAAWRSRARKRRTPRLLELRRTSSRSFWRRTFNEAELGEYRRSKWNLPRGDRRVARRA